MLILLAAVPILFGLPESMRNAVVRAKGPEEIVLDDYTNGLRSKWQEKSFRGHTKYQVIRKDGRLCIQANSRGSASGLYYKIKYKVEEYPFLTWEWKIENVLPRGDALHKEGDDYAARVYVIFPSWLFWRTTALNYIWANRLAKGKAVRNAFARNAVMIAVESGPGMAGRWVTETRNVLEDYREQFGEDPPEAGAIAIMTDADNTNGNAAAWYGVIRIRSGNTPEQAERGD
jgi:hypothetical protein